jgi:hypothetical protein
MIAVGLWRPDADMAVALLILYSGERKGIVASLYIYAIYHEIDAAA